MLEKITYKDITAFTWHYFRKNKKLAALSFVSMGAAAFIDTLFPVFTGQLVSAVAQGESFDAILAAFTLLIGIEVIYHGLNKGSVFSFNVLAKRNLYGIVTDSFAKVQRFSTDWHANAFAGGTVRKITRGVWSFDTYEDIVFMYLYATAIVMISTVTLMWMRWPIMGLITLVAVIIYVSISVWLIVRINAPRYRKSAAEDTKVGAALADAITANSAVKMFGRERDEERRFHGVADQWQRITLNAWQVGNANDLLRRYLAVAMMAVMIGGALYLWRAGLADTGDIVYVITAEFVLVAYLRHIGEQISNLQKAISEMEDIVFFWKTGINVKDAPDAKPFKPAAGVIEFDRVSFTYKGQSAALYDDFSITIKAGEKVALVGASGSGKSTFVKLVQRLYDIQGGEIRIDGQDIAKVTQSSLRRAIALVPQDPVLFHRSLAENIAYGKPDASMAEITEAAKKAYAHAFITRLPQGYDTLVGERGIKLSGGERQRVAIARAILADAPILILDEATSSLDSISEHEIQKALANLIEGRTTITIAHRLATIKAVDRILVFENGSIVEQGTHAALLQNPGSHYKALYEMQALDLVGE